MLQFFFYFAAGNFLEQDCGRVAAVIRAALVAVGRCFCCWERWTCGHLESAATLKARRRSCRSARASHSLSTCSRSSALLFHFPIILFCSGFLAALLENILPRCHSKTGQWGCLSQRRRRFLHSRWLVRPLYFLRNSDWEGPMRVRNVQLHNRDSWRSASPEFLPYCWTFKNTSYLDELGCDSDRIIRLWWARLQ